METHVASLAAEVQHLVDQKVPETTRSALQENTEVKARLGLLSQQTLSLMGENSSLRDRKTRLGVDVDILEQMLKETSRQSCVRKKVTGAGGGGGDQVGHRRQTKCMEGGCLSSVRWWSSSQRSVASCRRS